MGTPDMLLITEKIKVNQSNYSCAAKKKMTIIF